MNDDTIRPISHASTNRKVFDLAVPHVGVGTRLLDVGAGEGYFSQMMGRHVESAFGVEADTVVAACDVHPEYYRYPAVACDRIDPGGALPYPEGSFDVTCSLEVVEHVEDQFHFCRELVRITKPGGTIILSTPNVLNLNSRWRMLHSGFATLFDPLPISATDVRHTSGHIHPVGYYYLAWALRRSGAGSVRVEFDRLKNSARGLLVLCWPVITVGHALFRTRLRRKKPEVWRENADVLNDMQSTGMLLSRSIVVVATRAVRP